LFTGKTPDYLLKKGDFPLLYNLPIHTILLTMSLKNTHYCDILLNMSQKNAHFNLISPTQKMPKGGMEAACYQFNSFCEVKTASHSALTNGNFQSDSFYSHYFRIQSRKNPSIVYTFVECDVPQGTTHPKVQFHTVILHRTE